MDAPQLACVEPISAILALAALGFLAAYLRERALRAKLTKALAYADARPRVLEYRIERFDLIWYPAVTASDARKEILSIDPGLPHCKPCRKPLKLGVGEWSCSRCGAGHPESFDNTDITTLVGLDALKQFEERNEGYVLVTKR